MSSAVDAVREKVLTKPREPGDWLKADEVEEVAPNEAEMMSVVQAYPFSRFRAD